MPRWFSFFRRSSRPASGSSTPTAPFRPERGPSTLPKNLSEIRRLDTQHFYLRKEMGGNYLAPLTAPTSILDVGCGTGRWAMEMATQFPQAHITAFDIAPPTPSGSLGHGIDIIPRNVEFQVANASKPFAYANNTFDFVHVRLLYGVLPAVGWEAMFREMVRVSRPGGWIESLEALPFPDSQPAGMATIIGWFSEILRRRGMDPLIAVKIPQLLKDIGLQHITKKEINQTQTLPEQKEQRRTSGNFLIENIHEPVITYGLATEAEYERVAAIGRRDLASGLKLSGFNTYVTFGQLPMS